MPDTSSQFGPYTLLCQLGVGGMGHVYLARHRGEHGIERLVALKRILVHLTRRPKLVSLFLDEVRIAAQLTNGNIVQVIDHGIINGQYYMAMEYVHGETLMEVLLRLRGRGEYLPLDLVLYLFSSICAGLDYAHRKEGFDGHPLGIVHRDISPQNVLLSFQGEVKIADFGVARAAEQTHQTLGGELKGKLAYMAPEQALGQPLDQRADLFSLGVVLYETLANHSPFERENPMATLEAVRVTQAVSLGMVRPDIPHELVELVQRLLCRNAEGRPESARSVYEVLQQIMHLYNMVVTSFDLADYLRDLFPEIRQGKGDSTAAKTAIGRRADGGLDVEQQTICYLRQRQKEKGITNELLSSPGEEAAQLSFIGRRWSWIVVGAILVLAAAGAGFILQRCLPLTEIKGGAHPTEVVPPSKSLLPKEIVVPPRNIDRAPKQPRPIADATLIVRSLPPGAWVSLNGQRLPEATPLTLSHTPGQYACRVGLKGYKLWRKTVTLYPQQRAVLEARLEALPTVLKIQSTHPCQVHLNGQALGATPLEWRGQPGNVSISCTEAGTGVSEVRRLRLGAGEAPVLMFRFGILAINVEPWAEVSVDGKHWGTTPLRRLLPVGEHIVVLQNRQRNMQQSLSVDIAGSRTFRISHW